MTNRRPPSYLTDITPESRFITKMAESFTEVIDDTFRAALESGEIIDAEEPNWGSDEEMDTYVSNRLAKIIDMVTKALV